MNVFVEIFFGLVGLAALILGCIILAAWVVERRHDVMSDAPPESREWFV